jgi:hypothetical protein
MGKKFSNLHKLVSPSSGHTTGYTSRNEHKPLLLTRSNVISRLYLEHNIKTSQCEIKENEKKK